ncbi:MAG: transcription-repair coupling factor [Nitrospina sp.]|jgi:transcription-repair coupling factor (superfamily II helicase)|nr:transcription-repair coupling factor [Nitrospina sp.]MBT6717823.1 transcription-repair coupling factor [Nitrospina sp.]
MNKSISMQADGLIAHLDRVQEHISSSGQEVSVEGLRGSAIAFFLSRLHQLEKGRPVLVVANDQNRVENLLEDFKYFFHYLNLKTKPFDFPSWELLPYELSSPLNEISGERLEILNRLKNGENIFLIASVESIMQTVVPRNSLHRNVFTIQPNDEMERELLEASLTDNGFLRSSLVENRCEFSVRGDIVDFFQPGADNPIRIEFFGDTIESVREFDAFSQISINKLKGVDILPVRELCLNHTEMQLGGEKISSRSDELGLDNKQTMELQEKIDNLGFFSGMEFLAPFFFNTRETIFDYLPQNTIIALDEPDLVMEKSNQFENLVNTEFESCIEKGRVAAAPKELYLSSDELLDKCRSLHGPVLLNSLKIAEADGFLDGLDIKQIPQLAGNFDLFTEQVLRWSKEEQKIVIVAPTKGQIRRIHELMNEWELEVDVDIGRLSDGFHFKSANLVFIAEHEIFGRSHKHRHRKKSNSQSFQRGLKDLKKGDYLVHVDYGIGLYLGTKDIKTGMGSGEFLHIQYADDEKLYLPMEGLGYIQKYVGGSENPPPLSKMGGIAWKKQKKKVKAAIEEMAGDLIKLYASRETAKGYAYSSNTMLVREFADSFEYEETDDQLKAIEEVENDLENEKPTDRLICGDVGYGKTEVAMRAAFKVVLDKKQVAVLVPTTILAQQHLQTFQERFREYPVTIDMVNRFRTAREQKTTLEKLKRGEVDIIIGTHRLLSKDVEFASLGLIVVDEEQRFGVKHKEKLKKLRNSVDILTLTATPIPRTLHFSLMGVRDLSVIETPPLDRLAVKTLIRKFDEELIRDAILREVDRGGQVFFVHNKIHSIHSIAELIRRLVPGVRIDIAHGQLPEHQLEKVMKDFLDKKVDVLLSTSIVESGLDIPSANTIIINRADQFGLAQLYQLRGRVGRYKHQAYAYLLIPGTGALSGEARKRLAAMEELSELGAGFQLAARDMEIRGVGNMLGRDQSGHIASVGFDLYCKLVEDMVKDIRGEKVESRIDTEIDLMIKGFIPNEYVPDLNQRLDFYRRIQLAGDRNECMELSGEMTDRFGPHPEPVEKLLLLLEIRVLCQLLHISNVKMKKNDVFLTLLPSTLVSPENLTGILDERLRMLSEFQIGIHLDRKGWRADLKVVSGYLQKLSQSLTLKAVSS